jgi:hypothetical protein
MAPETEPCPPSSILASLGSHLCPFFYQNKASLQEGLALREKRGSGRRWLMDATAGPRARTGPTAEISGISRISHS